MHVILTDIDSPFECPDVPDGTITLQELKFCPAWQQSKFTWIFSYERGGHKVYVTVEMGKRYTFRDLQLLVNEHLNDGDQVAVLYHNNGRVTFRVFPDKKPTNPKLSAGMIKFLRPSKITLSEGIIDMLGLKNAKFDSDGIMIGDPVDESSIHFTFSDTQIVLFTCAECKEETHFNDKKTKALTAVPVTMTLDGTLSATGTPPSIAFENNYSNCFTFKLEDDEGNTLPAKQFFARLEIINDQRIRRKDLSGAISNSTAFGSRGKSVVQTQKD